MEDGEAMGATTSRPCRGLGLGSRGRCGDPEGAVQGGMLRFAFLQLWKGKQIRVGQKVAGRLAKKKCDCSGQDGGRLVEDASWGDGGKGGTSRSRAGSLSQPPSLALAGNWPPRSEMN